MCHQFFRAIGSAIILAGCLHLTAQAEEPGGDIRLMWYNVENLFHPTSDTGVADDEFTPEGVRHWTWFRYREKLTRIARVIVAAGQWEPPFVVGLGEVENALVLEDLVSHPILQSFGYSYLHKDSPDHRGIDVACLFRAEFFNPAGWSAMSAVELGSFGRTREMIHVWGSWGRRDTLDLFLVHFISQYRGSGATAEYREMQSARLMELADSIRQIRPGSMVVMAGDFNETWEGYSMEPFRSMTVGSDSVVPVELSGQRSSYRYQGVWSSIDQFLVVNKGSGYGVEGKVFCLPALIIPDDIYGGEKPFRTWEGYRYSGGFSDHLPILLDISRPLFFPQL
jgi:hypothetical protein